MINREEHLSDADVRRYIAALLYGVATSGEYEFAIEHLTHCPDCVEVAVGYARHLSDMVEPEALKPGRFLESAHELWMTRMREHPQPAMREAAAVALGQLEPLSPKGFSALLESAMRDPDVDVRKTILEVLKQIQQRQWFVERFTNELEIGELAGVPSSRVAA